MNVTMAGSPNCRFSRSSASRQRSFHAFLNRVSTSGGVLVLALRLAAPARGRTATSRSPGFFFRSSQNTASASSGAPGCEQHGAEVLAHRRVPVVRLLINQRVLVADRAIEVQHGAVPVLPLRRDLARDDLRRDAQDRVAGVVRERDLRLERRDPRRASSARPARARPRRDGRVAVSAIARA